MLAKQSPNPIAYKAKKIVTYAAYFKSAVLV